MKKITLGLIAHVDSGKTTLSEALLFACGRIRSFGRVDKGESFLDGNALERRRGITIYSKQAVCSFADTAFTLLDTPGHSDFSAEMERTLQVLDYALLIVSAADGIRGQTETIWRLLEEYGIPTVIFFNKMDQPGADRQKAIAQFRNALADNIVDMTDYSDLRKDAAEAVPARLTEIYDHMAMCGEEAMNEFLENGCIRHETVLRMTAQRELFPCFFGSALRQQGIEELLRGLDDLTVAEEYPDEFGARVFKILKNPDGERLTFLKVTGGSLAVRDILPDGETDSRVSQLRVYSGDRYTAVQKAEAGEICAVCGLKESYAGQGFGCEEGSIMPVLSPVLSYRVLLPSGCDPVKALEMFRMLEEENPELSVRWDEDRAEISVSVMGNVQLEVLKTVVKDRFSLDVGFDTGSVLYKETITSPVRGVGHFEPLRHYAEVHLLMEPLPEGSGLEFDSCISQDVLAVNWQRLIMTHLSEREHRGVLTGAPLTDMRITLIAGRAHPKHTSGGDFRQATYRAVRQGLMMTDSRLLEPYYRFTMRIPSENAGRALTDLERMQAAFSIQSAEGSFSVINGRVPVEALGDYARELAAYSKGQGSISLTPDGYGPCHNEDEVIASSSYDPQSDLRNTPDSVFCANGSGYIVPYDQVYDHMHIPFDADDIYMTEDMSQELKSRASARSMSGKWLGTDEIDAILAGVSRSGEGGSASRPGWRKRSRRRGFGLRDGAASGENAAVSGIHGTGSSAMKRQGEAAQRIFNPENADYMLVDGYNVIFAWEDLAELASANIDSARMSLMETLCNYQAFTGMEVIVVFDAYRVKGHDTEYSDWRNIHVVYTREAETADQYIERFAHEHGRKYRVTVVTSDGMEQIIIRGQGCALVSSREFRTLVDSRKL